MKNSGFEEKLITLSSPETLKEAKALLKGDAVTGVWRDRAGYLCGAFQNKNDSPAECRIHTGKQNDFSCSCPHGGGTKLCEHAIALILYSARFKQGTPGEETAASYCAGLRSLSLPDLMQKSVRKPAAEISIDAASEFPHVPSKWDNARLNVKLRNAKREYLGSVGNLRQLYFDKVLSVTLKYEDFSLQDQQIIRFLALNGEPDNSQVVLNSELTSEFFFCLTGFSRFSRAGRMLQVRSQFAEAILIRLPGKRPGTFEYAPGILVGHAVLPTVGARIITGRSGCWIGREGEYFFIPAKCELSWLRSFFRAGVQVIENFNGRDVPETFPLRVVDRDTLELKSPACSILLDGDFTSADAFRLQVRYVYELSDRRVTRLPDGGRLLPDKCNFVRRDDLFERAFEQELLMFGFVRDGLDFVLEGIEKTGLFFDRVLPEMTVLHRELALASPLCRMFSCRSGAVQAEMHLELLTRTAETYVIRYSLSAAGKMVEWKCCADCCARGNRFFAVPGVGPVRMPETFRRFFNSVTGIIRSMDPAGCTFELPYYSAAYFVHLTKDIPGALILELVQGTMPEGGEAPVSESFPFQGKLRAYQTEGVRYLQWMTDRKLNVILADEMGLGKTVQLLAFLASRKQHGMPCALVIAPASLVANWEREAARFVPKFRVCAPLGCEREKALKDLSSTDLLILSYTAARLSAEQLRHYRFSYLVLDEAQHIKNPAGINSKSCKSIAANHKIVLTGTPLENSPEDLWSIFDFLQPGMLGTLNAFRTRYGNGAHDEKVRQDLAARAGVFILRRTKEQAAKELPPKTEQIIYCTMEGPQRELYEKVRQEGLEALKHADSKTGSMTVLNTLLRLRQICCHPALLPDHRGDRIPSAKLELLSELLHAHLESSHKVLLFSQFTSLLALVIPELKSRNIPFEYLDGATADRQMHVDHFNNSPEIPLFLLSLKAGGTGLNLTSADTVILYDPWWNPAIEMQAEDRTHRIGQTRPVTSIKLVIRDSIEEKVLEMQHGKQEIFDAVIEHPAAENSKLSLDDLKKLLE